MTEGVLPSRKTDTPQGMEEERRLAFVAMTRARDGLYLTEAEGRGHEGAPRYPSRFLLDIDPAALEFSNKPAERELDDARAAYALADRWIADLVRDARFAVGDRVTHAAHHLVQSQARASLTNLFRSELLRARRPSARDIRGSRPALPRRGPASAPEPRILLGGPHRTPGAIIRFAAAIRSSARCFT